MTSEQIRQLVDDEIESATAFANPHGLDFDVCRVFPYQSIFSDSFSTVEALLTLWVVLEVGNARDSYRIVYSEEENSFGLATAGTFIGYYGSFIDTVEAM